MIITYSDKFLREFRKIKDRKTLLRVSSQIKKLKDLPEAGKPLRYGWKNHRSLKIPPFRIIYKIASKNEV